MTHEAEAPQYPVGTIAEMAAIPEEALPRFLEELPAMLEQYRTLVGMNAILAEVGAEIVPQTPVWIDDDKGVGTVTFSGPDGEWFRVERSISQARSNPHD